MTDGFGGTDQATVTITISARIDDPEANDDSFTVNEGGTATELDLYEANNLLDNDTDADLDSTLTINLVSGPNEGTLELNNDGTFTYVHNGGESIADSFIYQVDDGVGGTDQATVCLLYTSPSPRD